MNYKTPEVEAGYSSLHPIVRELCDAAEKWSLAYDKKSITLTDTLSNPERDRALKRESPAHSEGRAVDIRVKDWPAKKLNDFLMHFNKKFLYLGYLRRSNNKRVLMYLHGTGDNLHIHMAIGLDVIEKYKNTYKSWNFPVHKKKVKNA